MEQLVRRWEQARFGWPRLIVLSGDRGVGKSRLASEFAARVRADGGTVLLYRAEASMRRDAGSAIDALSPARLLRTARRHLIRRRAVSSSWRSPSRVRAESAVSPLLLVFDGLDLIDEVALLTLRELVASPPLAAVLVLGVVDEVDRGFPALASLVDEMRAARRLDEIALPGLEVDATRELVADGLGVDVPPAVARRLREQSHGNPFVVEETIREMARRGASADELRDDLDAARERIGHHRAAHAPDVAAGRSRSARRRSGRARVLV